MKTSCVLIPAYSSNSHFDCLNQNVTNQIKKNNNWEQSLIYAINRNKGIFDKVILINHLTYFNQVNTLIKKNGILNYELIVRACPFNSTADFAFASFEVDPDEILFVSETTKSLLTNREYLLMIKEVKELAAKGSIIRIDIEANSNSKNDFKKGKHKIYCFKAGTFLEELFKYDKTVFQTVKRAHFKKSNSFINELLDELIPSHSVEDLIFKKSNLGRIVKYKKNNLVIQ
ncbi:hypothetical protein [Cecembia rubra]|uniref:Uncharacterized protein n=1 Tax=Cecembia rubra TaxID=1485585 RepID=A0A2P8EAV7_9BACT|nr:hypothetical protein [Cecembia rubra]PSL06603.1 hypothetical protein CLV48_102421 [Cecembia rubra]